VVCGRFLRHTQPQSARICPPTDHLILFLVSSSVCQTVPQSASICPPPAHLMLLLVGQACSSQTQRLLCSVRIQQAQMTKMGAQTLPLLSLWICHRHLRLQTRRRRHPLAFQRLRCTALETQRKVTRMPIASRHSATSNAAAKRYSTLHPRLLATRACRM